MFCKRSGRSSRPLAYFEGGMDLPKQKLVIAEKPSVGMALAKVLGCHGKRKGYMIGSGYIVSWCIGHLAGLADAAVYDPSYAKWRWNDLPIIPDS